MHLTDVHTHSAFSADGRAPLADMLARARALGMRWYGVSEHFDYDYLAEGILAEGQPVRMIDAPRYFAEARRLQAQYAQEMRVLVGGEFGFSAHPEAQRLYREIIARFHPDFVVNSTHSVDGKDVWFGEYFAGKQKREAYRRYLERVRESLDAPYPYDIVAHLGYVARNAPYADKALRYEDFPALLDDIFRTIAAKDKILEVNSSARGAGDFLPSEELLGRYYALGGRKVSFASDAHDTDAVGRGREHIVGVLAAIGFAGATVPQNGRHILVPFD